MWFTQLFGELNHFGQGTALRRTRRRRRYPFTLTSTHTTAHHAYSDATTNIYPTTIKTEIHCHPTCISSPREYVQLVYTYVEIYVNTGKCTTIKMNVILVALIFPFCTLYIVTFSDVDFWDDNRGTVFTYVAFCPSLISQTNITWSPTPIHCPKATSHCDVVANYASQEASVYRFFKWILQPTFSYAPRKIWPTTIKSGSPHSQNLTPDLWISVPGWDTLGNSSPRLVPFLLGTAIPLSNL